MTNTSETERDLLTGTYLYQQRYGRIRTLSGFKKKVHTVPDYSNDRTVAFVQKIAEETLAEEAEFLFQKSKQAFQYKRKEMEFIDEIGLKIIKTKDFDITLTVNQSEDSPEDYVQEVRVENIRNPKIVNTNEFDDLFSNTVNAIALVYAISLPIEEIIDQLEESDQFLNIEFPADCSSLTFQVEGGDGEFEATGNRISYRNPNSHSITELMQSFIRLSNEFTKQTAPLQIHRQQFS